MLEQLTIIAPGLLGASVARAAHERGAAKRVVLWARRPETRRAIAGQPWCDLAADTPEAAVKDADLVVIAAPVDAIVALIQQIAPHVRAGAIVTDVGSVKGEIACQGHAALHGRSHFIGSHPMAGSEKTGWEHGTAALFEKRTCFVTPVPVSDIAATKVVADFWRRLGASVVEVDPRKHDEIVAHISHLPQVLASSLCAFLATKDETWRNYSGGGLRDTTRIAASDPQLWRAILEQNRVEVRKALKGLQAELDAFEKALSAGDWTAVAAALATGKEYRTHFPAT